MIENEKAYSIASPAPHPAAAPVVTCPQIRTAHKHRLTEERKQSASDLQSRLKTRKLLGVGELTRDNGDIYRSKISQLLGINESLYVRFPKGLLIWNSVTSLYFYIIGFLCLTFPVQGLKLDFGVSLIGADAAFVGRLYGAVLLSFGLLFRSILLQRETRSEIATLLLSVAAFNLLQIIVAALSGQCVFFLVWMRAVIFIGNIAYHTLLDGQGGILRQLMRYAEECCVLSVTPTNERPRESDKAKEEKKDEKKEEKEKSV